jgi:hypothetical protein
MKKVILLALTAAVGLAACGGTTHSSAQPPTTTLAPKPIVTTIDPTTLAPTTLLPTTTLPPTTTTTTVAPVTEPPTTAPVVTDPPTTAAPAPIVLPNGTSGPTYSPGTTLPVTEQQICTPGYATSVRAVTTAEKDAIYAEYGITNHTGYVIDHLVSLELGGSNDPSDLWPEPSAEPKRKDVVENALHDAVCNGSMSLADAQAQIRTWWTAPSYNATPAATTAPAPKATTPPTTAAASSGGGFTCADGTHSSAAHRQGACSHHGGIAG